MNAKPPILPRSNVDFAGSQFFNPEDDQALNPAAWANFGANVLYADVLYEDSRGAHCRAHQEFKERPRVIAVYAATGASFAAGPERPSAISA
jgi:hypothetical protein